jgi:hypothetical protein
MGLAERFREQLKNKDIFEDKELEIFKNSEDNSLTSKIIYDIDTDNIFKITNYTTNVIKNSTKNSIYKPTTRKDELRASAISKISKTPYWDDYSINTKTAMLEKYFDTKMKGQSYTKTEKNDFVKSILNKK